MQILRRFIINFLIPILLICAGLTFAGELKIQVKYISGGHIYLDKGKADGLQTDDTLFVYQKTARVAVIKIEFVASHSASCVIIEQTAAVKTGDRVVLISTRERIAPPSPAADSSRAILQESRNLPQPKQKFRQIKRKAKQLRGSVAAQLYHFNDGSGSNLDFTQPTFRLSLRYDKLWNKEYYLRIRSRTRHNQRSRSYSAAAAKSEWRNRIYELSLHFKDPNSFLNWQAGRIISNRISGVGYIDGILLSQNYSKNLQSGIFAGTQPEWQYSDFQTALQKYGAFFNYEKGDYASGRISNTIALAGEYHGSDISREYIYFNNQFSWLRKIFIYQSAELDYNRKWRKEKTDQTVSLTNLYFSLRWQANDMINLGIQYDNRQNYWRYEIRDLADSLFIDALRYGWRVNSTLKLPHHWQLVANYGIRKQNNLNRETNSYLIGFRKSRLFYKSLHISGNYSGFDNPYSDGNHYNFRFSVYLSSTIQMDGGIGGYAYQLKNSTVDRKNYHWHIGQTYNFLGKYYLNIRYENNQGDDIKGYRIFSEIGYRF